MENMTNTKALAINDIELLTFDEAAEIALDYINIKDHDILLLILAVILATPHLFSRTKSIFTMLMNMSYTINI